MKIKSFIKDFVLSASGIVIYNAVIQFAIYPYLQRTMGNRSFGTVLFWISIISLLAATFGTGCNYSRMMAQAEHKQPSGNYFYFLLYSCIIVSIVLGAFTWVRGEAPVFGLAMVVLGCVTTLRYYGDVTFRINTDYGRFSLYYILIGAGYLAGILLYRLTGFWMVIFVLGECLALIFGVLSVKEKRGGIKKNLYFREQFQSAFMLTVSQFFSNAMIQLDRILLETFTTGEEVTFFYVATLCGKLLALVSVPLNGVIIGYTAKYSGKVTKRMLCCFIAIMAGITFLFTGLGVFCSYVLIPILYPDVFAAIKPLLLIANLGQAVFISSGICQVVILKYTGEQLQLIINAVCVGLMCITGCFFVKKWGSYGMGIAVLCTALSRFVLTNLLGMRMLNGNSVNQERGAGRK